VSDDVNSAKSTKTAMRILTAARAKTAAATTWTASERVRLLTTQICARSEVWPPVPMCRRPGAPPLAFNLSGLDVVFLFCSYAATNDRPASWRMPTREQMEKLADKPLRTPRIDDPPPDGELPAEYWDAVLADPRAASRPWVPIQQRRLSEIPRELLRVECSRCFRVVEIQRRRRSDH
jgi:hypothetical protein